MYALNVYSTVGARYISMSAYQASRDDEVSFVSGAIVRLIKKYADGWWLVRYGSYNDTLPLSIVCPYC